MTAPTRTTTPPPAAVTPPVGASAIEPRAWRVLAVSAAGVFVVFLDATVVNIAFPAIAADFPAVTRAGLSWVLNGYAVVFGALLVTCGRLADDHGRKCTFQAGLVLFAAASALCGLAPSVPLLVAARALQAVGAALLVPASLALLLPEFPLAKRATAVGLWGAVGAVAAATGPSLGALLVQGPGWRWVFYINLPFCALAWVAGRRVLRESTGTPSAARPDATGVVLVTVVFGLLSLGLVQGQAWGWTSARVVGSFALAAVLTPLLVRRALAHPNPVLPVALFGVRSFSVATAGTMLFAAAFFANLLATVLFVNGVWHFSILRTALAVMPGPVLAAVVSPPAGRLADRFGYRAVIVPGAVLFAVGQAWFVTHVSAHPAYASDLLPGLLCVGVAIGLAFPTLGAAGAQALPAEQFAVGSAVVSTARQLGAVLGIAVLVAVLGQPTPAHVVAAFHHAWTTIGLAAAACAAVSLGLGTTTNHKQV
ncbi:MAG: DHA2 family efflux MFS transporter permease subunit [Actinomycetota bacterium]|nr:DHA2 family efflux MFS transporter permease subunit [Actinomycetota bacterium]